MEIYVYYAIVRVDMKYLQLNMHFYPMAANLLLFCATSSMSSPSVSTNNDALLL